MSKPHSLAYPPLWRWLVGTLVALTFISACGPNTVQESPATIDQESPNPIDSPLERHDTPPSGVAPQFEWTGEGNGGDPCPKGTTPSITTWVPPSTEPWIEVLLYFAFCFPGFSPHQPLFLEIRGPNSMREKLRVEAQPGVVTPEFALLFLPKDPRGRYSVTAKQGSRAQATMSLRLIKAREPKVEFVQGRAANSDFRLGTPITIGLAGYKARETLTLHLYREDRTSNKFKYNTTIKVRVDKEGEAVYRIRTKRSDPKSCYAFVLPPSERAEIFCLK